MKQRPGAYRVCRLLFAVSPRSGRGPPRSRASRETRTPQHVSDVLLCLGVGRHLAMGINGVLPRVVGRERQHDAALITFQEIARVPDAAADALPRIEAVCHAQERRGLRHKLHQPGRALGRDRTGIESRLRADHGLDQRRAHAVLAGNLMDIRPVARPPHQRPRRSALTRPSRRLPAPRRAGCDCPHARGARRRHRRGVTRCRRPTRQKPPPPTGALRCSRHSG